MSGAILVVGQSHVAAIRAAAKTRREADPSRPRTRVIHTLEPRYAPEIDAPHDAFAPPLADAIRDQIARHAPRVASCIGGNRHAVLGLIRHPRPFDFRLAPDDALDAGAEPLPLALVRSILAREIEPDLLRLRLLRAIAGPLFHLESPPPLRDGALIAERADAFFRDAEISRLGVAPAALRWRLWRLHGDLVREACTALGIGIVRVPADLLDDEGFLDPRFAGDATHGNEAYGERMIRAIEAECDPR